MRPAALLASTFPLILSALTACVQAPPRPATAPTAGAEPSADDAPMTPAEPAAPCEGPGDSDHGYLSKKERPDGLQILPPPPAPGGTIGKAETQYFLDTRSLADSPSWRQAQRDADLWGEASQKGFACAAGVRIDRQVTPTLCKVMRKVDVDAGKVYSPVKQQYDRRRPPAGNTEPICVPREAWIDTSGSYPSGHSTIGWSWALILSELVPDHTASLAARGREVGDGRVICGVHFPSDVEAGRALGAAVVARLHADPEFQKDMKKAAQEIDAARGLGAPQGCAAGP